MIVDGEIPTETDDDERMLIYLGHHPDPSFPWGGYHITITGRTDISMKIIVDIVCKLFH